MNGIINIFKPEGITSNGVIHEIKKTTGEKKIGHIGTLDPLATGILPLFLGKYTKLIPHFNLAHKTYRATARLGATSTTMDREGDITEVPVPVNLSKREILQALTSFLGTSEQMPPMYSAIKINGKKLYQYAREGKTIERQARKITIFDIRLLEYQEKTLEFEVQCSKGTYIRSLVDDIAIKVGTRAYLHHLIRTKCGDFFTEKNAIELSCAKKMMKSDLQSKFIDPKCILFDWHEVRIFSTSQRKQISQGRTIEIPADDICLSNRGKQFSNAIARTQNGELLATGILEFSQDSICRFRSGKVFI
ncbi:tRNA pseudouridine(55) synthase TruB [bacterium]|nr:tRNA pseudouridine(55) synthase TruB [bacterium]